MPSRTSIALAGLLLLCGCAVNLSSDPCRLVYAGEVPLWHVGNRLVVPARINGVVVPLILDTGGVAGLLSAKLAKALRLAAVAVKINTPAPSISGIGGARLVRPMRAATLSLGHLLAFGAVFLVPEPGEAAPPHGDADLIGMNLLSSFDLDFDLAGKRLAFFQVGKACTSPHVALTPPLYPATEVSAHKDNLPIVFVSIRNQRFRALLDTGSPQSLMFADAATRLGLSKAELERDPHVEIGGVGLQRVDTVRHLFEPINLGGLVISNMRLGISAESSPEMDIILGLDFLVRVHLWISNSSHRVVLQYPPAPSPRIGR